MKTKRLELRPLNDRELDMLLNRQTEPELIKAYGEMLLGCRSKPDARLWYTAWAATLPDGTEVGDICFKGPPNENGETEIGYGIESAYRGKGYATEAVRAMCAWGFSMPGCYFIRAETEDGNSASERVLEKCGFRRIGVGREGNLWEIERPSAATIPAFLSFGMVTGLAIGLAAGNMEAGICLGLFAGTAAGILLDLADRKKRRRGKTAEKYRAARENAARELKDDTNNDGQPH